LSKKTTQIIIDSQNDYLVTVKKNQKKLYELLELKRQRTQPVDVSISSELSRDRTIKRTVEFFDDLSCINQEYWRGVKSFICLTRKGQNGYSSPTKTQRMFSNNINYLLLCLE
jgi:hypothetical protein